MLKLQIFKLYKMKITYIAKMFGVSERTVQRWCTDDVSPLKKTKGKITDYDLYYWLKRHRCYLDSHLKKRQARIINFWMKQYEINHV